MCGRETNDVDFKVTLDVNLGSLENLVFYLMKVLLDKIFKF